MFQNNEPSSEIDTIEAAISKMSKLVAHISATGQGGSLRCCLCIAMIDDVLVVV